MMRVLDSALSLPFSYCNLTDVWFDTPLLEHIFLCKIFRNDIFCEQYVGIRSYELKKYTLPRQGYAYFEPEDSHWVCNVRQGRPNTRMCGSSRMNNRDRGRKILVNNLGN